MRKAELISGSLFSILGLVLALSMLNAGYGHANWFWRTGIEGFVLGILFFSTGLWAVNGGIYNLLFRIVSSVFLAAMMVLPMFIIIGLARSGDILTLLFFSLTSLVVFIGTVGVTVWEATQRI